MFSNIAMLGVNDHPVPFGFNFINNRSSKGITMLNDLLHDLPDDFSLDEFSSPISWQLFEYCDPELFQTTETLTNSEVASSSNNCCYEENSSYTANILYNTNNDNTNYADTTITTMPIANQNSNLPILFNSQDEMENDIAASIHFSTSLPFSIVPDPYVNNSTIPDQFNFSSLQPAQTSTLTDLIVNNDPLATFVGNSTNTLVPPFYEDDCLSSFLPINNPSVPTCSLMDPTMPSLFFPGNMNTNVFSAENSVFYTGNNGIQVGSELDYQGGNGGIFCPDSVQRLLNSGDLQALNNESQQLMNGGRSCSTTPLGTEISSLDESAFKVGKLSVEQRKEKIHRYMKKRNERNFSKKIKYACRKTLADSRPRVRGRFAKNEEFGENHRLTNNLHEDDDDDDLQLITVKEEDDLVDSSDIFSHISGVNSFKCNYSIQSWI